jgi:hypothetical protein
VPKPSAKEISPHFGCGHEGLDERFAREAFSGKSLMEAEELFRQNALFHGESLHWMGAAAFRFYVMAFISYLKSEHAKDDPDAINGFAFNLEWWAKKPRDVSPIAAELAEACLYVVEHYEKFSATPEIYSDLRSRYQKLAAKFNRLSRR